MTACRILAHAVTSRLEHGASYAVIRCETHDMPMEGPVGAIDLCPIGRIEQATEEALKKIAEANLAGPVRY